jgi:hypothetical protein
VKAGTAILAAALLGLLGCDREPDYLSLEELMDPESCKSCHPRHYDEWASSMHAYAADDPVFLAMNARGQRETNGALGDFCVQCHAPMAVLTGATTDGLNLEDVPQKLKGVTCYFCHTVEAVEGTHNNPLVLADDGVMRGGFSDPVANEAHRAGYSPFLDRRRPESADMCGACHDIVTPAGVHLERTYLEWQESIFSRPRAEGGLTCSGCHMESEPAAVADYPGVPLRRHHEHLWPGVDVAITPWPGKQMQLAAIERDLLYAILPELCVVPDAGGVRIDYRLDNVNGGHMVPTGSAQDRRMWAEIVAYDADGEVILESGVIAPDEAVAYAAADDPHLWQIRDYGYDEDGNIAHMFWDVRSVESELLPPAVTNDISDPRFDHSVVRSYPIPGAAPARVTARIHLRPMGLDVLDDLIGSGDLDPSFRDVFPTFTLDGTVLEWTADDGLGCVDP